MIRGEENPSEQIVKPEPNGLHVARPNYRFRNKITCSQGALRLAQLIQQGFGVLHECLPVKQPDGVAA